MNVALEYIYRDAGNNKLSNAVIFQNSKSLDIEKLECRIKASLIDGQWFVAEEVGIPALKFERTDLELDHEWHEFHGLFETALDLREEEVRDIEQVVSAFEASKKADPI